MSKLNNIIVLLFVAISGCNSEPEKYNATNISGVDIGSNMQLVTHEGNKLAASGYIGKVNAVFFGYSHCPDICSPVLYRLSKVKQQLGDKGRDFQVVFITVDPEYDTAEQLKKFVSAFDAGIVGLTGSARDIEQVKNAYKVAAILREDKNKRRIISHSGNIFIYDRKGNIRLLFREDTEPAQIVADINRLLAE